MRMKSSKRHFSQELSKKKTFRILGTSICDGEWTRNLHTHTSSRWRLRNAYERAVFWCVSN